MIQYAEHRRWSIVSGERMVRLSVGDERGGEFFMLVPYRDQSGEKWKDRRDRYLGYITEAMELGCAPGEVRLA